MESKVFLYCNFLIEKLSCSVGAPGATSADILPAGDLTCVLTTAMHFAAQTYGVRAPPRIILHARDGSWTLMCIYASAS